MFRDYYAILEVNYDASSEDIKSAYRQLSKKWHPDVNPDAEVTSKMQDINEAYCVLKDAEKVSTRYRKMKKAVSRHGFFCIGPFCTLKSKLVHIYGVCQGYEEV